MHLWDLPQLLKDNADHNEAVHDGGAGLMAGDVEVVMPGKCLSAQLTQVEYVFSISIHCASKPSLRLHVSSPR